jgi:UDP-N-acetylmuramate dehydrogenase
MQPLQNVSLAKYSTMGLGGVAAFLVEISSQMQLLESLSWAQERKIAVIMIGGGSNTIWRDEGFNGLIIVNKIMGYEVFQEDETNTYITVGAGEPWDSVVARSVASGLTGIEALSLVPGSSGATPVQNVGAYGQEISQTLVTVQAFDTEAHDFVTIPGSECGFGYRLSRFNSNDKGRFYIINVTLHLIKGTPQPPFYGSLQTYFEATKTTSYTPQIVRDAVIVLRTSRLPDPAIVHNAGSFFANPVINDEQLDILDSNYSAVPHWPVGTGSHKISAAWLIDQAGFKAYTDEATGMATWPAQSLVLINDHAKTTADLLQFKQHIVDAVKNRFNIELIQEPELLPLQI